MELKQKEWEALAAICDAFIPSIKGEKENTIYWETCPSQLHVPQKIVNLIKNLPLDKQWEFKQLIKILSSHTLGLTYWGRLMPVHKLNQAQKEKLLLSWSKSSVAQLRSAFITLKKLTSYFYLGSLNEDGSDNINWPFLDYEILKSGKTNPAPPLPVVKVDKETKFKCDVLIIGSGAGGSIVAAELAKTGKRVLVVEKGNYVPEQNMSNNEVDMFSQLYERGGALTSKTGGITVLAGSGLGGGTTVNWAGSFRTPDYILEEWAKEHGNPHFLNDTYRRGFDVVEQRNHIHTNFLKDNPQNALLKKGGEKLGYKVNTIPVNMKTPENMAEEDAWKAQGFSCFGDKYGIKQSALQTHLRDAAAHRVKILVNTEVEHLIIRSGKAKGAVAVTTDKNGRKRTVNIYTHKVVVAAGSIHTPALLLRSGVKHPHLGRHLRIHPTVGVSAVYKEPIRCWNGPMMSVVCDEFTRMDGNYGFKMETPPAHPGLMNSVLNWTSGKQYKADILDSAHRAFFIVLTRDKHDGRVFLNRQKQPSIDYNLSPFDRRHLVEGMKEAVRIHDAAGAIKVDISHNQGIRYISEKDNLEKFLEDVEKLNWEDNHFGLFTAHQMGTCRMGGNAKTHPIKPSGECWTVENLYVADASLFPSASGVNPMLSIQALAYYVAQQIKATL